jgi:hypothetical protein
MTRTWCGALGGLVATQICFYRALEVHAPLSVAWIFTLILGGAWFLMGAKSSNWLPHL